MAEYAHKRKERKIKRLARKANREMAFSVERKDIVYIVITEGGTFAKIGRTQTLAKRLDAIQTGCPLPLYLYYAIPCRSKAHASEVEKALHTTCAKAKTHGEWFKWPQAKPLLKESGLINYDGSVEIPIINDGEVDRHSGLEMQRTGGKSNEPRY